MRDVLVALAARLGAGLPAPALPPEAARFLDALADDLAAAPGAALVLAGPWTPPEWQALVHWINDRLDAPIDWLAPPPEQPEDLPALAAALRQGEAGMLVILGANPAYDAPADLGFAGLLRESAAFTLHLGPWRDETAALCQWHLPGHHPLEDWSDARAPDGTASIAQPLIRPLYGTRPAAGCWGRWRGGSTSTATRPCARPGRRDGPPAASRPIGGRRCMTAWWRAAPRPLPRPVPRAPALPPAPDGALTLLLRPDPMLWDGRFANNPWLQECPKPLTRQVWGNAALMAPAEAARHGRPRATWHGCGSAGARWRCRCCRSRAWRRGWCCCISAMAAAAPAPSATRWGRMPMRCGRAPPGRRPGSRSSAPGAARRCCGCRTCTGWRERRRRCCRR
ncbi:molybdopterin-dependent oxidoreductase family protein [Teichococcus aestuarii]|uniref:hypothetical protein n=1 Tax=Teichococcus aestuarii TaxID=568898 RepID=UPI00361D2C46